MHEGTGYALFCAFHYNCRGINAAYYAALHLCLCIFFLKTMATMHPVDRLFPVAEQEFMKFVIIMIV